MKLLTKWSRVPLQVYMVATKILYFYFNQQKIGKMLKILEDRFLALGDSRDHRIRKMQRFCYFQETILFLLNYFNGVMLALSFPIMVNSLIVQKKNSYRNNGWAFSISIC